MTAAAPVPTAPSPFERPAQALWTDVPRAVARVSPNIGRALNERAGWLEAVPPLLVLVVPAAIVLGGLLGAFHWGCPAAYSSSLTITASLLAISCACGAGVGVWLTVGYALGDFLVYSHPYQLADTPVNVLGLRVGLIVSYIGLYILLALVPMTAAVARRAAAGRTGNIALAIGAQLTVAAVFAFAWAQSVPLMLRPMFVWAPDPTLEKVPPIGAINPIQSNGLTFAVVAALFSIGMVVMTSPEVDAWSPPPTVLARTGPAQGFIRAFVAGAVFTLMFSGLALSVLDFVVLYGLILTASLLRLGILPLLPGYMREVGRVPLGARIIVPMVVGGAAGFFLLNLVFADNDLQRVQLSFMPVIISLGIGLIAGAFALPAPAPTSGQPA
jgi:hypothetical protein